MKRIVSLCVMFLVIVCIAQTQENRYKIVEVPDYVKDPPLESMKKKIANLERKIMEIPEVVYAQVIDYDFNFWGISEWGDVFDVRITLTDNRTFTIVHMRDDLKMKKHTRLYRIGDIRLDYESDNGGYSGIPIFIFNINSGKPEIKTLSDLIAQYDYIYNELIRLGSWLTREKDYTEPSFGYRVTDSSKHWYKIYSY